MLTVQTIDGLPDADTYVSAIELAEYASKRGIVLINDAESLLIRAMDYIESKTYRSSATNALQATAFPRVACGLPLSVKKAQLSLAVIADTTELMPNIVPSERIVRQESVDSISVSYEHPTTDNGLPKFSQADALLKPYLKGDYLKLVMPINKV